jgi:homoserine O-succinyltransferase
MSISLKPVPSDAELKLCSDALCANPRAACRNLRIGLLNNMPDAALEATERQFLSLLDSAAEDCAVEVSFYFLPGVCRGKAATRHMEGLYSSVESLWDKQLDGLIVTGREPLTANLADEPYWGTFETVVDWARENTHSTVWSCLAAHAAVLSMDGIGRIRSSEKHFGIFECDGVMKHPLMANVSANFRLPHSRWNGLPEDELTRCGYDVLTRSSDAGVDTFVRQQDSLFVFFQGHPEYEANTLMLEYRRDVGRFVRGETERYPLMPRGYFDQETEVALTVLEGEAEVGCGEVLFVKVSTILEKAHLENTWSATGRCIYRNWLRYIDSQKQRETAESRLMPISVTSADRTHSTVYASGPDQARPRLLRAAR